MKYIDLHVHSTASDGSMTPSELVHYAKQQNLSAFALTDHDTVSGIEEALEEAKQNLISVIPGIELSAEYLGHDIHILGLNIDYKNQTFLNKLEEFRAERDDRNQKMIRLLNEHGFPFTQELIHKRFGNAVITRAHYAILMVEGGYVKDKDEAFFRYLNPDCPCYVPRTKISVSEAVRLILLADGKPVLAHPFLYKLTNEQLIQLVSHLKENGLLGIEAVYSLHSDEETAYLKELANQYGLFITGGSDYHGTAKPSIKLGSGRGNLIIPEELLKNI